MHSKSAQTTALSGHLHSSSLKPRFLRALRVCIYSRAVSGSVRQAAFARLKRTPARHWAGGSEYKPTQTGQTQQDQEQPACSFGTLPQGQSSQPGSAISNKFMGSLSHPVLRLFQVIELGPKDPKKEVVCKRNPGVGDRLSQIKINLILRKV